VVSIGFPLIAMKKKVRNTIFRKWQESTQEIPDGPSLNPKWGGVLEGGRRRRFVFPAQLFNDNEKDSQPSCLSNFVVAVR
jgi:hypothetical protein